MLRMARHATREIICEIIYLLFIILFIQIIYVISEENKLLLPYTPNLKNVTTLPCKIHNFLNI